MREAWSQFEQAWRDTLVHKAEAAAFKPLCNLYNVRFPESEVSEKSWAEVLKLNAYGTRGNFETVFKSTEFVFSKYNVKVSGSVEVAQPAILKSTTPWPANSVNRLIRKKDKLYFSEEQVDSLRLKVVTIGTFYWDAPEEPGTSGENNYLFEILPFVIFERSPGRIITSDPDAPETFEYTYNNRTYSTPGEECLFEVVIFLEEDSLVPKTWIQSPASYSNVPDVYTPENVPYGGAILTEEASLGDQVNGPYPLYAYDGTIFPDIAASMSSTMAASVEYKVLLNPPI